MYDWFVTKLNVDSSKSVKKIDHNRRIKRIRDKIPNSELLTSEISKHQKSFRQSLKADLLHNLFLN